MTHGKIAVRGARQHNLRNLDVEIPRDRFVVITGISGSGKSSLAFDTVYAEGQRRYVESLSAYARQFLEQMQKPDVESIEGLPPTISIEQRTGHSTPRSTVATSTEIYDHLRLLFARVGRAHCHKCGREISQQTPQQIIAALMALPQGEKATLLAPLVRGKKGAHRDVFQRVKKMGFVRLRVDGEIVELREAPSLDRNRKHDIEIVVDRLVIDPADRARVADSVETALRAGDGLMIAKTGRGEQLYSQLYACPLCGVSLGEIQPRLFSFNSPYGACPTCDGLGTRLEIDEDLIVPDPSLSLREGAIEPLRRLGRRMAVRYSYRLRDFCSTFGASFTAPYRKLEPDQRRALLHGAPGWDGVIPHLMHRFENTDSDFIKRRILGYMSELECATCGGRRLRPEALAVRVGGKNIHEVTRLTIQQARDFFDGLPLSREEQHIARMVLKEIRSRLRFLVDVGLDYLNLDRRSNTLAGGESQRIRLASQLGSGLVGVCYVLDEPTIGLHQRDNRRLLGSLFHLRDQGNTVLCVEHDEDTIREADWVIDIGPGAGKHGGTVVAAGTPQEIASDPRSLTGRYLSGEERIPLPARRRETRPDRVIEITGAREHNLKNLTVRFPLGTLLCLTGVSGSGKSTLMHEILYKGLRREMSLSKEKPGDHDSIAGAGLLTSVVVIDQSPIGRTSRSNPATYTGVFDEIRKLYALAKEARARGYSAGRFSFNVKGGRCESCQGDGVKVIEMHFLPDVHVTCEECRGRRYNRETLEVQYRGKNISDVLEMSIEEAMPFFANHPKIVRMLKTLDDVGLGYVAVGQPSTTLSGGEAQRVKLATELGRAPRGSTLYLLDEPTTGLHFSDIRRLLEVLNRLVDAGHTVIVIEHNLHVIKTADHVVDLGPEGGARGGEVIATGTPEEVARHPGSYTGQFLRPILKETPVHA
jgi:excinuclease ABC subunit A